MPCSRIAALEFTLRWQSPQARHTKRVYFEKLNFWRDFLPGSLVDKPNPLKAGECISETFAAGALVESWSVSAVHRVKPEQVQFKLPGSVEIMARRERFYPRGWPRPAEDKYANTPADTDPLCAIWGRSA